jgi:nucleotide-binding universal stress UspA family protein
VDGRILICADGSPSSRRIFPFFKHLLPAVGGPVDLVCVRKPAASAAQEQQAAHCLALAHGWLSRCGRQTRVLQPTAEKRFKSILDEAGGDSIIVMGESQMHDVRRRTFGSLPMKVLARTDSSFLMAKHPTEPDAEMFEAHLRDVVDFDELH